uniref:Uncharacterized protein n=1 Tax=viral metagenome TaxID=1070528 RepID=A0A6H1ZI04_9ZZZZ
MGNTLELQVWADESFGGVRISKIVVVRTNVIQVTMEEDKGQVYFYLAKEENLIDFKNKVLWAYEEYLRNKRSSG